MTQVTDVNIVNAYVKAENLATVHEFDPADYGVPTEAQLGIAQSPGLNNHNPNTSDPSNYFIFDAVDWDPIDHPRDFANPIDAELVRYWMIHNPYNLDGRLFNGIFTASTVHQADDHNPGGAFNEFTNVAYKLDSYKFFINNGPRDLGYMNVQNRGWLRINDEISLSNAGLQSITNQAWLQGSLEMTLKPQKQNCTIVSGVNFSNGVETLGSVAFDATNAGRSLGVAVVPTGLEPADINGHNNNLEVVEYEVANAVGPGSEYALPGEFGFTGTASSGYLLTPVPESGLSLTTTKNSNKYMSVNIVNGVVSVTYKLFYGNNAKDVTITGTTNIVDDKWHHVVINRPSQFTFKTPESRYGGKGCIEIWVDGKLDKRSYEITSDDILPTPQILFNDAINPGVLNWRELYTPDWMETYALNQQYIGGIREFVLRQTFALTPGDINKNYAYAILNNANGDRIVKAPKIELNAKMINPSVSVNKKTVLKLYWNNLLKNKEQLLDGLEFDDTFNVKSYSVTHRNLINDTQTFNLDLTNEAGERKYLTNVKTAVNQFVYIYSPTLMPFSTAGIGNPGVFTPGFAGRKQVIDLSNNPKIAVENYANWNVSNLLFGGVSLQTGDRILLLNQYNPNENGIWIYQSGTKPLIRDNQIDAADLHNAHVYVEKGKYAEKTFVQTENVSNIRTSTQRWKEIDNNASLSTLQTFPIHTTPWSDQNGDQRFINVLQDINFNYDVIAFMNYPKESKEILASLETENDVVTLKKYKDFINSIKSAVNSGKRLYVSSPMLAVDLGIVNSYVEIDQLVNQTGDAQSASISPFESGEPAANYFDTHRNNKYRVAAQINGLTNRETYIMSDFVTYSANKTNSDYHIKYNYRQFGLLEGDEFIIPGLTTVPETLNGQLPGYLYNQRGISPLAAFAQNSINLGTMVTKFSGSVYNGSTLINNPYSDYATTIAVVYGTGKMFVNCVENAYAFSRSDYNTGIIQNVTVGENSETALTAAWQYSTKRLNKKNLYDFSETSNLIGQTTPTDGGGGAIVQSQSHCSNGVIRKKTNQGDLQYQSDLYPDETEEVFTTTKIPVLSMTWLGLKWLAE